MEQSDVENFIAMLENVQREDSYGYGMFYIGEERLVPFVSIADSDNEYDNVSNLDREGVYRINIGVSRATFDSLLAESNSEDIDYAVLNVFLPHPHYAKQHFVCILNPTGDNVDATKKLIIEAHAIATSHFKRRTKN